MEKIRNSNRVGNAFDDAGVHHICFSPAKRPEGFGKFLRAGENQPMQYVGMSEEDYNLYIDFLKRLHPEFGGMIVGTYDDPVLHFNNPNPVHRFRLYCMFRFMWEQPAVVSELMPHIKKGELLPVELEFLAALLSVYSGHTHIQPCKGDYDKETLLRKMHEGTAEDSVASVDYFLGLNNYYYGAGKIVGKLNTTKQVREAIKSVFGYQFNEE